MVYYVLPDDPFFVVFIHNRQECNHGVESYTSYTAASRENGRANENQPQLYNIDARSLQIREGIKKFFLGS
jgi:hypothetical protein